MKYYFYLVFWLVLNGCNECNFAFPKEYRELIAHYTVGDTIYFQSDRGDVDTIAIVKIDSVETCGSIMVGRGKEISVEIQHLPLNNWIAGTSHSQDGSVRILNQSLIDLGVGYDTRDSLEYGIGIQYRSFLGGLTENRVKRDDYFADLGISTYWEGINEAADWKPYLEDSTIITKILWTKEYGLTGYVKRNGEHFKILASAKN